MRLRLAILLFLLIPIGLQANPAILNPQSLTALFCSTTCRYLFSGVRPPSGPSSGAACLSAGEIM